MPFYKTLNGRARALEKIVHTDQGGGMKKGGLPYMIGRPHTTSIAFADQFCNIKKAGTSCGGILTMNGVVARYNSTTKGMVGVFVPGLRQR